MTYATVEHLVDEFGELELIQLTDRANTGTLDADVVARALADADEQINSYLSQRYTLPLPSVPQVVISRACDIARFRLHKEGMHEEVRKRYEEAIAWLKDVVAKKAGLGFPDADSQPEGEGSIEGEAVFTGSARVFTRGDLEGF